LRQHWLEQAKEAWAKKQANSDGREFTISLSRPNSPNPPCSPSLCSSHTSFDPTVSRGREMVLPDRVEISLENFADRCLFPLPPCAPLSTPPVLLPNSRYRSRRTRIRPREAPQIIRKVDDYIHSSPCPKTVLPPLLLWLSLSFFCVFHFLHLQTTLASYVPVSIFY